MNRLLEKRLFVYIGWLAYFIIVGMHVWGMKWNSFSGIVGLNAIISGVLFFRTEYTASKAMWGAVTGAITGFIWGIIYLFLMIFIPFSEAEWARIPMLINLGLCAIDVIFPGVGVKIAIIILGLIGGAAPSETVTVKAEENIWGDTVYYDKDKNKIGKATKNIWGNKEFRDAQNNKTATAEQNIFGETNYYDANHNKIGKAKRNIWGNKEIDINKK